VLAGDVGADVVGTRERGLLERLGPPARRRRRCLIYEEVGRIGPAWELCAHDGRVTSARGLGY
jgi:hypothetical protein